MTHFEYMDQYEEMKTKKPSTTVNKVVDNKNVVVPRKGWACCTEIRKRPLRLRVVLIVLLFKYHSKKSD
ncbi:hypothetical protein AN161_20295 [Lysinibacillus sp. FJAT-14222]|nr:hypothetical protein AN161_20295 [Lysinibacillus sp. FJAT-14222]